MDIKFSIKDPAVTLTTQELDALSSEVLKVVQATLQKRLGVGAEAAIAGAAPWFEAGGYAKFSKAAA